MWIPRRGRRPSRSDSGAALEYRCRAFFFEPGIERTDSCGYWSVRNTEVKFRCRPKCFARFSKYRKKRPVKIQNLLVFEVDRERKYVSSILLSTICAKIRQILFKQKQQYTFSFGFSLCKVTRKIIILPGGGRSKLIHVSQLWRSVQIEIKPSDHEPIRSPHAPSSYVVISAYL